MKLLEPKKIASRLAPYVERLSPRTRKYAIWTAVITLSFVFGLIIGCESNRGPRHRFFSQELGVTEVIDSFIAVMPEGANVIARFNDERHSLYYLKSGHLMRFNAQSKMLEEVTPETSNANLEIYYDDADDKSGIIAAKLSKDEKYILFTAVTRRRLQEDLPPTTQNYQLNTESLNMLAYEGKALDPIPVKKDTVKVQKASTKSQVSETQAETATHEGTETTVVPAAEAQHEEPKASEPKHETGSPKEHENTAAPVE